MSQPSPGGSPHTTSFTRTAGSLGLVRDPYASLVHLQRARARDGKPDPFAALPYLSQARSSIALTFASTRPVVPPRDEPTASQSSAQTPDAFAAMRFLEQARSAVGIHELVTDTPTTTIPTASAPTTAKRQIRLEEPGSSETPSKKAKVNNTVVRLSASASQPRRQSYPAHTAGRQTSGRLPG